MKALFALFLILVAAPALADVEDEIEALLKAQQQAWNAGDLEGYMDFFWKSDDLRFASGGIVTTGWDAVMESYQRRYGGADKMGKADFDLDEVKELSETHAIAFGSWEIDREEGDVEGLFTLLLEKRQGAWKITALHSSENALPLAVVSE